MKPRTKTLRENQQNIVLYRLKLANGILALVTAILGWVAWKGYSTNTREIQQQSKELQVQIDRLEKQQEKLFESECRLISIVNKHTGQIDTLKNSPLRVVHVGGLQTDHCIFSNCGTAIDVGNKVQK